MYSSFLFGYVPDAGWTAYTPLSGPEFSGTGLDFWLLGLSMVEIAGISAASKSWSPFSSFAHPAWPSSTCP
jgi:cytochrome c oxidase subunit I+III